MRAKLVAALAAGLWLAQAATAAELKVLASGAVKDAYLELVPDFEKASGNKVATTWAGTVDIKKRIAAGEVFDLVIVAAPEVDAFITGGQLAPASRVDLMKTGVGVAVKAGARKPDISSSAAVKQALLDARSVAISTGPSGVYLEKLFAKLGVGEALKAKTVQTKPGTRVAEYLARGEAELGFQQVSELINEKGIDLIGPLPADIQNITVFSSGVHAKANEPAAAKALQKYLTASAAVPVIKRQGMEPGSP